MCSATDTGTRSAISLAISARARAPATAWPGPPPDNPAAPPAVIWTIPSEPASANPFSAALSVSDDVTLMAG